MNATQQPLPTTIPDYLAQLRTALAGADAALVQDALYDAEEYLRSELAEHPDQTEAEVIAVSWSMPEDVLLESNTEVAFFVIWKGPVPPALGGSVACSTTL